MLFNFGDTPWKFPPRDKSFAGFSGLNAADTVPNEKKGEGVVERKIIANAPQARLYGAYFICQILPMQSLRTIMLVSWK